MAQGNDEMRQGQGGGLTRADDERDLLILMDWEAGWPSRTLAKRYGVSIEYVATLVQEALA